ncbi:MAG: glutaminyl-tRNA synthetase [Flavobacteriales bacterium]|jgi:glutaminyl-tRNA synthetase|tara:strand:+ start:11782 stop:13461 length:1680 start_codon:yes stop_codon:yes gene_type:complete
MSEENEKGLNFIEQILERDLEEGLHDGRILTRFPPEPNGFLHIGHSKAICLNFEMAKKYGGKTNLRFDDTNPEKEDTKYVDAIKADIKWLGFDWNEEERYTSDYFDTLYEYAVKLISEGKAYVDEQSAALIAEQKGTPTETGNNSPFRDRSAEENLERFTEMKDGKHPEGSMVLRAKIDMTSPNMHLRDPFIYRIKHESHHRTGDKWCVYPMYDFAHGQSDSIEGITHSFCSLEFEVHRPLYNWLIQELEIFPSKQREFARLNLNYTIMSKRKLLRLVEENVVDGWDDPRMPTISGLRRRGYTAESIRNFCDRVGIARRENVIDVALLEFSIKEHLNKITPRVMCVLEPIKVVITNYPEGKTEELTLINNPEDEAAGSRNIPFSREIFIERNDFMEEAPRKYFRLKPEGYVRLKGAYIIQANSHVKDESGNITEVHCTYFPDSKSGEDTSGIKAKGVIHWVSTEHALDVEVRQYDRLFSHESPDSDKEKDFMDFLNPDSLEVISNCKAEPHLKNANAGDKFQFQRLGYFCVDSKYTTKEKLVFNRTVTLRDSWSKLQKK